MATKSKNLVLVLDYEYFDQVEAGEKPEEYREFKQYWVTRLVGRKYEKIIIRRGYTKTQLEFPYNGYEIKTITHKKFGNKPKVVFAIPLVAGPVKTLKGTTDEH